MSHFTVCVIGSKQEEQLEPYDERITTEPTISGEVTDEEKQSMIDFYVKEGYTGKNNVMLLNPSTNEYELDLFETIYAEKGNDWNDNTWEKRDGKWVKITTYNPKSKWDWYQLGGRWSGLLKLKEGATSGVNGEKSWASSKEEKQGYVDQCLKGDIDIEGMRDEAGVNAGEYYDKVMKFIDGTPEPEKWENFVKKVESGEMTIESARLMYHEQSRLKSINTEESRKELGWSINIDDFGISREEYVENARKGALSTFALIKDGVWYQRGEMGWWAMVSNEKEQSDWNNEFSKLFDELPEDTLISIYDCHI